MKRFVKKKIPGPANVQALSMADGREMLLSIM